MSFSDYTVIITRAPDQAKEFAELVARAGCRLILAPAIRIKGVLPNSEVRQVLEELEQGIYSWIIFTSANGVRSFHEIHRAVKGTDCSLSGIKVAVQGSKTAQCFRMLYGRECDLMPPEAVSESLLASLAVIGVGGSRVLLPVADRTRDVLSTGLNEKGVIVRRLVVYHTLQARVEKDFIDRLSEVPAGKLIFTFFSPSAFHNIVQSLVGCEDLLRHSQIATIGPITSKAVTDAGFTVSVEAAEQTQEALLGALEQKYR